MGSRALALIALAGVAALVGPAISYRSDVDEVQQLVHRRIRRDTQVYAAALSRNLVLLQAELERLAARSEIDLRDDRLAPEQALLDQAHHHSALFGAGVLLFDADGELAWSEPKELPALVSRRSRTEGWWQRLMAEGEPVVDVLAGERSLFLVAVPVLRDGGVAGALVGLLDARKTVLPVGQPSAEIELLVFDAGGDVLLPAHPPAWTRAPRWSQPFERLLASGSGDRVVLAGRTLFAGATLVGDTGMRLALVADEDALIQPMRSRFLVQMFVVAGVQVLAALALVLFVRRTWASMVEMERRSQQQEKLAALGTAASLIAHEVKNSLNGLNAAAASLEAGAAPELAGRALRGQIDRLRHLATSLLQFGK
ncbi:MAG: sensor histidine kinase, partial [Myxococcales bacterium]